MPFDTSGNYYNDGSDVSEYDSDLEESQNPLAPHPQLALRNPPPTPAQDAYSKTGAALSAQGNVRPSLWRSLLAGGAEFMLGKSHPQAAQVFGDAITQTDPSVRANMNLQRTYQIQGQQAQAERLKQAQERMERQNQSLVGLKMQAERDRLENQRAQRLNQAVDKGFTPSPSSVDIPAPGAVSSPDLPPTLQAMSPQTMNTPLPAGALPPLAPIGSTPAKVSGQQGYYIPPDARERMKKQADAKAAQDARQQALQERGIPTPPALKAVAPGIGDRILPEELPRYADILKSAPVHPDQQFQATVAKVAQASGLPPGSLTDVNKLAQAIKTSQAIEDPERSSALAYLATKTTPAAQGSNTTLRVEGMGANRENAVIDTKNGNSLQFLSSTDINKANQNEPGRYIPAAQGVPALNKTALIEDIRGSIQQTRDSLAAIPEFSNGDKVKIAVALRDRDPRSAISQLIGGEFGAHLNPAQQEYLINLSQLHEQALAMRSVLGAGQGSEDLRAAILRTIPGPGTPNKAFAAKQLDKFEQTLNRLSRGLPTVPLRNQPAPTQNQPSTSTGGMIQMKAPDGTVKPVPADQVDHYLSLGATRVQ